MQGAGSISLPSWAVGTVNSSIQAAVPAAAAASPEASAITVNICTMGVAGRLEVHPLSFDLFAAGG
jgi:hypothetical protein